MDGNISGGEGDNFDWGTEDEQEIDNFSFSPSCYTLLGRAGSAEASGTKVVDHFVGMGFPEEIVAEAIKENGEENTDLILETLLRYSASSSASSSNSKLIDHFVGMGFSEDLVAKAIQENGEGNTDSILETLLTYSALETLPAEQPHVEEQPQIGEQTHIGEQPHFDSDQFSSEYEGSFLDDFSDMDSCSESEDVTNAVSGEDNRLLFLARMGYTAEDALIAIERCGPDSTVAELTDFICAAQMSKAADLLLGDEDKPRPQPKRKCFHYDILKRKKQLRLEKKLPNDHEELIRLPNPMIGYGVPNESPPFVHRTLPDAAKGPPYFFYENVALAPKGVWDTISRFLYEVEPEFVDSRYFCAAARKRGYIHNLPIQNRFPLLPTPPLTIQEAFPLTRKWWPSWDMRTKLNCLQTCIGSAKLTERIRKALKDSDDDHPPSLAVQKYVLEECRKWNLVWVGRNKVATLEADEVEMLLGFPKNHTRGISRTDRYKSLGNSFQVDTVAYQLSVLKDMFPRGINLLSLFSGIGGAEVALHRLGIPLKNVVAVEISEVNRNIVRGWWEQTNQRGNLIHIADVQEVDGDRLEQLMNSFGGFDLVVGGSPCNNLAGSNRHHRDGLEGRESSLFYDYCRILDLVNCITKRT